ncbi:hypothetical protein F5877DRAFT_72755 [Lentinula edodes]|nr:hypothetical protein F5877DRAFT_72755 [Lentinula edodes]
MAFANDACSFRTLLSGIVSSIVLVLFIQITRRLLVPIIFRFIRKSKKKATRFASSRDVKREPRSVRFNSDVEMNSASEDELVSGTERSFKQKPTLSFIKHSLSNYWFQQRIQ